MRLDFLYIGGRMFNMKDLILEIFGHGYTWSYRWFRVKELFDFLPSYYELTVIPSIVLGCMTTLGWYVIHYLQCGFAYATPGEAIFAFLFFLGIMTVEDVYKYVTALRRVA